MNDTFEDWCEKEIADCREGSRFGQYGEAIGILNKYRSLKPELERGARLDELKQIRAELSEKCGFDSTRGACFNTREKELGGNAEAKRDLKEGSESGCDIPDKPPSQGQSETSRTSPATSVDSGSAKEDQTIEEYAKKYLVGLPTEEQIVQLMHDYDNGCGMHNFKDCDLYERGTWQCGRWKDKVGEVKFILSRAIAKARMEEMDKTRAELSERCGFDSIRGAYFNERRADLERQMREMEG